MKERQRYYRAIVQSETGKRFTIGFRNDNLELAREHAEHCARGEGYRVIDLNYIGTAEPLGDFGAFKELA